MTLFEHEEIARAEGRAEGRANAALKAIPLMIENGISLEKACEIMDMPMEEYKGLQERMAN